VPVLAATNAAALANVDHHGDPMALQLVKEIVEAGIVHAHRRDHPHRQGPRIS
jgi:hypothetical protein